MINNLLINIFGNLCNKIFSFLRLQLEIMLMRDSAIADAYSIANRSLALLRRIFIDGSFEAIFTREYIKSTDQPTILWTTLYRIGFILLCLSVGAALFSYPIALALRFKPELLMPYSFFLTFLSPIIFLMFAISLLKSVLNTHGLFWVTSMAPMLGNIGFILTLYFLGQQLGQVLFAMALGGLLYSLIQVLLMFWFVKPYLSGAHLEPLNENLHKKILHNSAISLCIPAVEFFVHYIALQFKSGTASVINYAHKVNDFFFSILGVALTSVLTPIFAKKVEDEENSKEFASQALFVSHLLSLVPVLFLVLESDLICANIFRSAKYLRNPLALISSISFSSIGIYASIQVRLLSALSIARGHTFGFWINLVYSLTELFLSIAYLFLAPHINLAPWSALSLFCSMGAYGALLYMLIKSRHLFRLSWNIFYKIFFSLLIIPGFNVTYRFLYSYMNLPDSYLFSLVKIGVPFLIIYILYIGIFWKDVSEVFNSNHTK